MRFARYAVLPLAVMALSACESQAEKEADKVEDQIENQAEQSAVASGNTIAALGMTEAQLLDADLVASDGTDLGDVEQVRRDAAGAVTGFLVEIKDSKPDRFVEVPLAGLTVRKTGLDQDLQTTMNAQDLAKLPAAKLTP